jgi:hypothetical protein
MLQTQRKSMRLLHKQIVDDVARNDDAALEKSLVMAADALELDSCILSDFLGRHK